MLDISGVIFDLGDTLTHVSDWPDAQRRGKENLLRALRKDGDSVPQEAADRFLEGQNQGLREANVSLIEYPDPEALRATLQEFSLNKSQEFILRALDAYHGPAVEACEPVSGSLRTLQYLNEKGYKAGVISNSVYPSFALTCLRKLGFEKFLEPIIISVEFSVRKPHREIFLHVAKIWGISPEKIAFVGDQPWYDTWGAMNAGMKGVLLKNDAAPFWGTFMPEELKKESLHPDKTIHSLSELVDWLKTS